MPYDRDPCGRSQTIIAAGGLERLPNAIRAPVAGVVLNDPSLEPDDIAFNEPGLPPDGAPVKPEVVGEELARNCVADVANEDGQVIARPVSPGSRSGINARDRYRLAEPRAKYLSAWCEYQKTHLRLQPVLSAGKLAGHPAATIQQRLSPVNRPAGKFAGETCRVGWGRL